jgi:hypothetical protein
MNKPIQRRLNQSYALVYASMLPTIVNIGRQHGYAMAVHGSMATDLDIVACPWSEDAKSAEDLVEAIREWFGLLFFAAPAVHPTIKPHGRLAWSMSWPMVPPESAYFIGGPYIDISVMPRLVLSPGIAPQ